MSYFLLVYDRLAGQLVSLKQFDSISDDLALKERLELELEKKDQPEIEVVVLGGPSLEALKKTHGRYFRHFPLDSFDESKVAELKNLSDELAARTAS